MARPTLESLTNELFERIVFSLCLDDIRHLRLTSRTVAYKATQDAFRSCSRSKRVYLTRPHLEQFIQATLQGSRPGCLVEDLTLVGVVYNLALLQDVIESGYISARKDETDATSQVFSRRYTEAELKKKTCDLDILTRRRTDIEWLVEDGTDMSLLNEAFANIVAARPYGLNCLSLQIAVYRNDIVTPLAPRDGQCWKLTFEAASRTFNLVTSCIRQSQLSVRTLDIFSSRPVSLGCNLPCDALHRSEESFSSAFARLRKLAISVSDCIIIESEFQAQDSGDPILSEKIPLSLKSQVFDSASLKSQIARDGNYSSLATMLQASPSLEELEVSGYSLPRSNPDLRQLQEAMRHRSWYYLAQMKPLPLLRRLRLAGLAAVHEEDLVTLLTHHSSSLYTVELNHMFITKGSLAPVLSCLTSKEGIENLESIHLEDIWEHGELVQFSGERERGYTQLSGVRGGRNVLRQWGPGVKDEIDYQVYRGKAVGSPEVSAWGARRMLEFGRRK